MERSPPRLISLVNLRPFLYKELAYIYVVASGGAVKRAALGGAGLVDCDLAFF